MRLITLDTCTLLWLAAGEGLPAGVLSAIEDADGAFVSAISAFEIGLLVARGRLALPLPAWVWWTRVLEVHGLVEVPLDAEIGLLATSLPRLHADPADRVIIATAQHLGATLLTPDARIREYPDLRVAWG